jgi:transcriptional regulator with XRE-family HTH domain
MSTFGERLKRLRNESNVHPVEIAGVLGVQRRVLFYYESGDRFPTVPSLIKLADYFDVSLDYLVGRSDNPERR